MIVLSRSYHQGGLSTELDSACWGLRRDVDAVQMNSQSSFLDLGVTIASRAQILALGATSRDITHAILTGELVRVRRDHYALPGTDRHILRAVRVGGRLSCDTALRSYGLFGFDDSRTHIHVEKHATRLRSPAVVRRPLTRPLEGAILHWDAFVDRGEGSEYRIGLLDALGCVVRCGRAEHATASIDNALHTGAITEADLATVFAAVPANRRWMRHRLDARCESGQESVLRLALEAAGYRFEIQVSIPGVGRVDFLVDGRLICEADSRLAHEGWEAQLRDRERDLAAARLGFVTLRPAYPHIMQRVDEVMAAIAGILGPRS
jgi:very-short-patch-repair endonuclease